MATINWYSATSAWRICVEHASFLDGKGSSVIAQSTRKEEQAERLVGWGAGGAAGGASDDGCHITPQ